MVEGSPLDSPPSEPRELRHQHPQQGLQGRPFHPGGVQHSDSDWSNLGTGIVEAGEESSSVNNSPWVEATLLPTTPS